VNTSGFPGRGKRTDPATLCGELINGGEKSQGTYPAGENSGFKGKHPPGEGNPDAGMAIRL